MSSAIYYFKRQSCDELKRLSQYIIDRVREDIVSPELVVNKIEKHDIVEVLLLVFEKYYLRTSSMAVLVFQCISNGTEQTATVVGTGGGNGLFNYSMGANKKIADTFSKHLKDIGFEEISEV